MPLSPLAAAYDQFILDLDGSVWIGEEPTPRAVEAVEALRDAGKEIAFATNDPRSGTEDYVARLWKIGIRASLRDVVTVGGALQHLLAETRSGRTAFVIGTDALRRHVTEAGLKLLNGTDLASRAEVVVVGGTEELTYEDLRVASLAARRGADFQAHRARPHLFELDLDEDGGSVGDDVVRGPRGTEIGHAGGLRHGVCTAVSVGDRECSARDGHDDVVVLMDVVSGVGALHFERPCRDPDPIVVDGRR